MWFEETMKFISTAVQDAGGNKPFFTYLPTNAPHGPFLVAEKWKQPFLSQGIPAKMAAFKGMVANFDWNLGRLLKFLDDEKLAENTIVIFMTDNGSSGGSFKDGGRIYGWPDDPRENGNMRGGKSSAYDGGHRVPCFIRWPSGNLGQPRDIDTLAAHFDLTPTLMELCQIKRPESWPALDGRSLAPLIRSDTSNNDQDWQPRVLHSQMHGGNGFTKPGDPWEIGVAMTERWRLVEGDELYDIIDDPQQRNNVAEKFPDVVKDLDAQHRSWHKSLLPNMVPTLSQLGGDLENPSSLTSQEWAVKPGNPPWARQHVVKRSLAHGSWHVDVMKPGKYQITLSRWPLEIEKAIDSTAAKIEIAGQTLEQVIADPDEATSVVFELELPAGPTELSTSLTTPKGKTHGAYFAKVERVVTTKSQPQILWAQYCRSGDSVKLSVHTDADPLNPVNANIQLQIRSKDGWQDAGTESIDSLTAMAKFRIDQPGDESEFEYRVVSGASTLAGRVRPEPVDKTKVKLMAIACINDKWFPYTETVTQMINQDPDLVFFAGDQIYESNAGGEVIMAETKEEVPEGMANYLAKWRKFGLTFRDLLKDRPSIMITDDHDVYANDLWGDGGRRMNGDRTTGGYPTHIDWVNAVEATQTWHLPDPASRGPWGDGVNAYYTSMDYGGVSFAILEDRKFKSPPSAVLTEAIADPNSDQPNRTLEVIKDPTYDTSKLDRDDLQLLGGDQELFVSQWAARVASEKKLAAVLSQSPLVNIGNYDMNFGDMDANGWPQSARNRALRCMNPAKPIMIHGDIHFGTLHQHGIDEWGDGPWGFSLPAFSSKQNRMWRPTVAPQGGAIPGVVGSGNHHDRFGNKLTVAGTAHGFGGYGMVIFDKQASTITCELHTLDQDRKPDPQKVAGWPKTIKVFP